MSEIELSIGSVKSKIPYKTEAEKEIFLKVSKELNTEYNKIITNLGNVEESILLFFMLFKTEVKIYGVKSYDIDNSLYLILQSFAKFLTLNNQNKIKEFLVVLNVIKKIELNKKSNDINFNNSEEINLINNFVKNIKSDIEGIENNILLS